MWISEDFSTGMSKSTDHIEEVEKMRKVFSRGNIKLDTSKAEEKDRLHYVLSNVSPDIVVERLKSALASNVQTRTALTLVFDKKSFPPPSKARCTRCDEEYDPNYNSRTSCQLPHEELERVHKHSRGSTWECAKCCGSWESSSYDSCDDVDLGFCFEGAHTDEEQDSEEEELTSVAKRPRL